MPAETVAELGGQRIETGPTRRRLVLGPLDECPGEEGAAEHDQGEQEPGQRRRDPRSLDVGEQGLVRLDLFDVDELVCSVDAVVGALSRLHHDYLPLTRSGVRRSDAACGPVGGIDAEEQPDADCEAEREHDGIRLDDGHDVLDGDELR